MSSNPPVTISAITNPADFTRFFAIAAATFGHQTQDGIWLAFHPGFDTPEGASKGTERLIKRWESTTRDRNGDPNTIFLKATVPRDDGSGEEIAGVAIWVQASAVEGRGQKPAASLAESTNLEDYYPGNPTEQKYLCQLDDSLHRQRLEYVNAIAESDSPAVFALDLCTVDPAFQRRGIAGKLVEWGLYEARRRGGLEAVTEASAMGRSVYAKLGFVQQGSEVEYAVDEEFKTRARPSNVFMRTGGKK
ncbi:hypothetical protein BJY04DRAFT_3742 [Aspergillus karnatakaensis]|uniref:GNAT family N-acetyltransferase n=1 Tax=Aspergillus karnatakaensis TaxID=1810916 RepID=UPI003CCD6C26